MLRRLIAACLLASFCLSACAARPWWMAKFSYSAQHGDFTVRYNYCVGRSCPAPDASGSTPKNASGWVELKVVHAADGLQFYRNGVLTALSEARDDPFYSAALTIGLGMIGHDNEQLMEGFQVVSEHLKGGYMADAQIARGVQR